MSASVTANDFEKPCSIYPDFDTIWKEQWKNPPYTGPTLRQGPKCGLDYLGIRSSLTPFCGFNDLGLPKMGKFRRLKNSCTGEEVLGEFLECYPDP